MKFKLVLSEPFDTSNQRRLASAFLLIPNNQEAMGDNDVVPDETASSAELTGLRGGLDPATNSTYRYRQNAGFMSGLAVSSFTWDADGRTANFSLKAPVKTGSRKEGEYAFVLVQQDDQRITDKSSKAFGMDRDGNWGAYIKGGVIYSAIKRPGLVLAASLNGDDDDRWRETHQSWTKFSVARDMLAPKLVSVLARRNYADDAGKARDQIEFTFSEPMVAYPNVQSPSLLSLNNYVVTSAPTESELANRAVGGSGRASAVSTLSDFAVIRDAIKGSSGMVPDSDAASSGNFLVKLSVSDPKVVILQMPAGSLPLDAEFVKVYAGNDNNASSAASKTISDPAGNTVDITANTAVGPIF
jgi:hypothetical protein